LILDRLVHLLPLDTDAMVVSYRWLRRSYLDLANKPLRPHSAVSSTACPGKNLRSRIGEM
jgi:hypothetical protein